MMLSQFCFVGKVAAIPLLAIENLVTIVEKLEFMIFPAFYC